jgi:sulfur-oxidizing protein SoxZ
VSDPVAPRAVLQFQSPASKGAVIEIHAVIRHPMESGFRRTERGELIAANLIRQFVCRFNGKEMFRADLHPGMGADPSIRFPFRVEQPGEMECEWLGDQGLTRTVKRTLTISQP